MITQCNIFTPLLSISRNTGYISQPPLWFSWDHVTTFWPMEMQVEAI